MRLNISKLSGLFGFCLLSFAFSQGVHAVIIDPANRIDWIPGLTVGVRGGIPTNRTNLIDITGAPYFADKTGVSNCAPILNQAISAAPSNSVIYLPNGSYRCDSTVIVNTDGVTLRGQSTNAIIFTTKSPNPLLSIGGTSPLVNQYDVISGSTKGSTSLGLTRTAGIAAGELLIISTLDPSTNEVVTMNVAGFQRNITQTLVVTSVSATHLTVSPPLAFDFRHSPKINHITPRSVNPIFRARQRIGLENLRITLKDPTSSSFGSSVNIVVMQTCVDSWITGCVVDWSQNYNISLNDVAHVTIQGNTLSDAQGSGSNHAGLLTATASGCLIENNIFKNGLFPGIEFNGGFTANAVAFNFFNNNPLDIDNHGPHPVMNLWEGNRADSILMDGYFGSASHQTLFRNLFDSTWNPLAFKRWTTKMQVVGNVLGKDTNTWFSFTSTKIGQGNVIFTGGYPNIGNGNYIGQSPPIPWNFPGHSYNNLNHPWNQIQNGIFTFTNTQGPTNILYGNFTNVLAPVASIYALKFQDTLGADTNKYYPDDGTVVLAVSAGTSSNLVINTSLTVSNGWKVFVAGQVSYQQMQLNDSLTHTFHGNYDYADREVKWSAAIADRTLPASLLYTNGAPGWWGTNRWPAMGSDLAPFVGILPAQLRHAGTSVGSSDQSAPSAPGTPSAQTTGGSGIGIVWTASTDNTAVTTYFVERSQGVGSPAFSQIGTSPNTTFNDSGLLPGTVYNYRVRAGDAAGNLSGFSPIATATTATPTSDQVPPSTPASLVAAANGTSSINLSWGASTDNVGVTGYLVERSQGTSSTTYNQVATSSGVSWSDAGLSAATVYNYRVRAADAAGNLSGYSSVVTATTKDVSGTPIDNIPPSAPIYLRAEVGGADSFYLSWGASTDNVAVAGYRLERSQGVGSTNFKQINAFLGTSCGDVGLTGGGTVYNYRVRAVDGAGNVSAYSPVVTAVLGEKPKPPAPKNVRLSPQ